MLCAVRSTRACGTRCRWRSSVPIGRWNLRRGSPGTSERAAVRKRCSTRIRKRVHDLDSNLPVFEMITLEKQMENSLVTERLVTSLSTGFGLLATVLAAIGLYGVMAYTVTRRTREIGIRMAIGAAKPHVLWLIMREVLILLGIGMVIALPLSWALTQSVRSQLYGIQPTDPLTVAAATLAIAAVAMLAGYLPARRASKVHPMLALRYE